ncbi:putative defensin-like protein 270 [Senna tora]|nr:putative defensin-like protein 270 [Senna tora]
MASTKAQLCILLIVSLMLFAPSTVRSQSSDCVFAGDCKTKADCAAPCSKLGHSPTAVLCVPYPPETSLHCCCLVA